jgi:hypothetical protein
VPAGALDTMLKDRLSKAKNKDAFAHMGIAVVDLTGIGENPDPKGAFSMPLGANAMFDQQRAVGSLSKIHCMFAAYFLLEQVAIAAAAISSNAKDAADVAAQITADWKPIVSTKIPKSPHDFPNLTHMFDFVGAAPWGPSFKDDKTSWDGLVPYHESSKAKIDSLKFKDRMKLMIRFSDNMASGSCVRDVGFQYINGALDAHGFTDNAKNGILWLGTDFGYTNSPPIMGTPPWDNNPDGTWVRANARGIASYLTLVWTNRLVNKNASKEIREDLLLDRSVGFATYIGNNTPNTLRTWSKIGLLGGTISEGVIIEASAGAGTIRYAAIGLGATRVSVMEELATIFYLCVKAQH